MINDFFFGPPKICKLYNEALVLKSLETTALDDSVKYHICTDILLKSISLFAMVCIVF